MRTAIRTAVAILSCAATLAFAQDYEREKRWADEVEPGVVVGDAVWIPAASGRKFLALYAPAKEAKGALVIVHGAGVHPDHGLIGILRAKLTDMGYTTLSIQMPVLAADAKHEDYPKVFPDAFDRIARASAWLRERTPAKQVLVSHSMGAYMSNAYLDAAASSPFAAWVCVGRLGPFTGGARALAQPTLDIYGEQDFPAVLAGAEARRKALVGRGSRQTVIAAADHFFVRHEDELARAIDGWLAGALK
ncbi:hypothetical protein DSM104443_03761 [Usitatibacter rugosus]|uniref:DUF3530 family protein n=1 Tax=Usitatibacter rugosus TaxID=2732067 RepID=A0A6M4GZI8_9PROT|nr:DUF3530 family protein [Usitatibacter rugosus]QJR12669.1 hypothetical protein DSM104443_03761 [Usitatibacter rugosus]